MRDIDIQASFNSTKRKVVFEVQDESFENDKDLQYQRKSETEDEVVRILNAVRLKQNSPRKGASFFFISGVESRKIILGKGGEKNLKSDLSSVVMLE